MLHGTLEKIFHLLVCQVDVIEQFKEFMNLFLNIAIDVEFSADGCKVKQKPRKGGSMADTISAGAFYITELGTSAKQPGELIDVTLLRDETEF